MKTYTIKPLEWTPYDAGDYLTADGANYFFSVSKVGSGFGSDWELSIGLSRDSIVDEVHPSRDEALKAAEDFYKESMLEYLQECTDGQVPH